MSARQASFFKWQSDIYVVPSVPQTNAYPGLQVDKHMAGSIGETVVIGDGAVGIQKRKKNLDLQVWVVCRPIVQTDYLKEKYKL